MTKEQQTAAFDPDGVGVKGTLFGLPFTVETASVVVIPVAWDVTASYGTGTADGPEAILEASSQLDYAQLDIIDAWKLGVTLAEPDKQWKARGQALSSKAEKYINWLEAGAAVEHTDRMKPILDEINYHCRKLMLRVEKETDHWLKNSKMTVLLGGDHSTCLGHIKSCAKHHGDFGLLQIDAHADLRLAYEGFTYSHASIMRNVLDIDNITKLVQVGVRDFCPEELEVINQAKGRIKTFFDHELKEAQYAGKLWQDQCEIIVNELPEQVYVSFDIDGLDPKLCPNTGTPVPGGFELDQVMYLIKKIVQTGRKIVGVDLCEVASGNDELDANVGARALYRLTNLMAVSQGALSFNE